MNPVDAMVFNVLGARPRHLSCPTPLVRFDVGPHLRQLGAETVAVERRQVAAEQTSEAYQWCQQRFPLATDWQYTRRDSITLFEVGQSLEPGKLLSASSPQAPGRVLLAASWPLKSPYRLGSIMAHESMHQALYLREREGVVAVAREGSLGYSPWKQCLRPGRLVWHSFWTFGCQYVLLGEAAIHDRQMLLQDEGLVGFLADMDARLALCLDSLAEFGLLPESEMKKCKESVHVIEDVSRRLHHLPSYKMDLNQATKIVFNEFEQWSRRMVKESVPLSMNRAQSL